MAPPLALSMAVSPMHDSLLSKGMMSHEAVTHSGSRNDVGAAKSAVLTTCSCETV